MLTSLKKGKWNYCTFSCNNFFSKFIHKMEINVAKNNEESNWKEDEINKRNTFTQTQWGKNHTFTQIFSSFSCELFDQFNQKMEITIQKRKEPNWEKSKKIMPGAWTQRVRQIWSWKHSVNTLNHSRKESGHSWL